MMCIAPCYAEGWKKRIRSRSGNAGLSGKNRLFLFCEQDHFLEYRIHYKVYKIVWKMQCEVWYNLLLKGFLMTGDFTNV